MDGLKKCEMSTLEAADRFPSPNSGQHWFLLTVTTLVLQPQPSLYYYNNDDEGPLDINKRVN